MFRGLLFLALYLPLENFLLKWLPLSETAYALARQLPDLLVLLLLAGALMRRSRLDGRLSLPLIGGGADGVLAAFVGSALLTMWLNGADPLVAGANLKALLRYVLVVYVVLLLQPEREQLRQFGLALGAGVLVQLALGAAQWLGGAPVHQFLAARETSEPVAGLVLRFTGGEPGSDELMGTLGNTINYGMFLLVGLVLWTVRCHARGRRFLLGALLLLAAIHLTGSRAVMLTAVVLLLAAQWVFGDRNRFAVMGVLMAVAFLDWLWLAEPAPGEGFAYVFTEQYLRTAYNQRLGLVVYLLPDFLAAGRPWLGVSPDMAQVVGHVAAELPGVPGILFAVLPQVVEDVYWVALLLYYGLIGTGLFVLFLSTVFRGLWRLRNHAAASGLARGAMLLLFASLPLNLFNQAFEVRQFAFFLWAYVGFALAAARHYHEAAADADPERQ